MCAPDGDVIVLGTESFSFSVWLEIATRPPGNGGNNFDHPFHAGGTNNTFAGFGIQHNLSAIVGSVGDGTNDAAVPFDQVPLQQWAHFAVVVDRPGAMLATYLDGVRANNESIAIEVPATRSISTEQSICFGSKDFGYAGVLDEARVYRHAQSAAWIDAEVDNVKNRAAFVAFGAEQRE